MVVSTGDDFCFIIKQLGDIAQLIERFAGSEEVRGLSPRISTILTYYLPVVTLTTMYYKRFGQRGFTIVELLIVIVVIGVLAALVIVAYNGIQTRAKNTKTISAANAWVKIIKQHQADNGSLPSADSCLGNTTTYTGSNGQCWDAAYWTVRSQFITQVQGYTNGNFPEPDITDITSGGSGTPKRGLLYITSTGQLYMMLMGTSTACADVGLGNTVSRTIYGDGVRCAYNF